MAAVIQHGPAPIRNPEDSENEQNRMPIGSGLMISGLAGTVLWLLIIGIVVGILWLFGLI
ncbi:MAG: hypothetical protein JWN49_228 [Parcubacteria group bacterium]|nr:hypothetical protein [Parcubacteria group bacterium]